MLRARDREVLWRVNSKEVLREFPENVRWVFGRALYQAQLGKRHENASPLKGRLRGILEIAGNERGDTYRLYYTLKCPDFVFVLYCHKKKSKRGIGIPKHEEDLILGRLREAMESCNALHEEQS